MVPNHLASAVLTLAFLSAQPEAAEIQGISEADLIASVDDGMTVVEPGGSIAWTITVTNQGPADTLAQVADTFPAEATGVTWECMPAGTAICAQNGIGDIFDVIFVPSGGSVTYVATAMIDAPPQTMISNTILVGTLNGVVDPVTNNNVATDTDQVAYTQAPTVTILNSAPSPGSCGLLDGIEIVEGITQLTMRFSQQMLDPAGDTDPTDVSNPDNYRLVEAGPNGVVDSEDCATLPAADDVSIELTGLGYDTSQNLAGLHVDGNLKALPAGQYRVFACSAGLSNSSGLALDGQQTGSPGSDFRSDFHVFGENLLVNPNFDHPLASGWTVADGQLFDNELDADDSPFSGSVAEVGAADGAATYQLDQCVHAIHPGYYRIGVRTLMSGAGSFGVLLSDCAEAPFIDLMFTGFPVPVLGGWDRGESSVLHVVGPMPPEGLSVFIEARLDDVPVGTTARMDSFFLRKEDDDLLFRTGTDFPTSCPAP